MQFSVYIYCLCSINSSSHSESLKFTLFTIMHLSIILSKEPNYTAAQKSSNKAGTPGQRLRYYLPTVPANDREDPAEVFNNIPDPGAKVSSYTTTLAIESLVLCVAYLAQLIIKNNVPFSILRDQRRVMADPCIQVVRFGNLS